jgi:D-3-phosphoglycerate dehydrogenase / 2-oxoglutarate reductase
MLKQMERFQPLFKSLGVVVTAPEMAQTLTEAQLIALVPEHDAWIIGDDPATRLVFEAGHAGRLRSAVKWGIGVDNVDREACNKLEIPFANTPGLFGAEVADLAICYLLGLARQVVLIDREVRAGNWYKPAGISVQNKQLGIVGLGDIGQQVAKRARAHDLEIMAWDPMVKSFPSYVNLQRHWPDGLGECDFVVFACALTDQNKHMFDETTLEHLKVGVSIINVSRGPLIKETALIEGLQSGIISAAALDVFEQEPLPAASQLLEYPRCIFGSHNASNTIEAVERASYQAIDLVLEQLKETRS